MGAISFVDEGQSWVVAGWAFRGYLAHVLKEVSHDPDLRDTLEQAMALDGLHFSLTGPAVAVRLAPVMLRVADEVVAGVRLASVEGRVLDAGSQLQFREAVAELRSLLDSNLST
jgi:hypothetical protein